MLKHTVYYLPGWGGQLKTGLGHALISRGLEITGRETRGDFKDLGFNGQVSQIAQDLQDNFWTTESRVIANSFGGYV